MEGELQEAKNNLGELYRQWSGYPVTEFSPVSESGSNRIYLRVTGLKGSVIGVYNQDLKENEAFIRINCNMIEHQLRVPEIYMVNDQRTAYLQKDLGDLSLFDLLDTADDEPGIQPDRMRMLEKSVQMLPSIQELTLQGIDSKLFYPRKSFDRQSMMWDLNYFKYNFLKLVRLHFDEQALEDDFNSFIDFLDQAPRNTFLYRDFQSRNILIYEDNPWFIDFQGGRLGFPAYDLASFLFDAKARISPEEREHLLNLYLATLKPEVCSREQFIHYYPGFIIIRKLQALGAFGLRGIIEKKISFLQSIPPAMENLSWITSHFPPLETLPELWRILEKLPHCQGIKAISSEVERNYGAL